MTEAEDEDEGKVVWPIPEDGISYLDAVTTVFDISEAIICLSEYAENGNDPLGNLALSLFSEETHYFHKPLKLALEEKLDLYGQPEDIFEEIAFEDEIHGSWTEERAAIHQRTQRLIVRLLRAYHEWEANEATWTPEELRARPLPPMTP